MQAAKPGIPLKAHPDRGECLSCHKGCLWCFCAWRDTCALCSGGLCQAAPFPKQLWGQGWALQGGRGTARAQGHSPCRVSGGAGPSCPGVCRESQHLRVQCTHCSHRLQGTARGYRGRCGPPCSLLGEGHGCSRWGSPDLTWLCRACPGPVHPCTAAGARAAGRF